MRTAKPRGGLQRAASRGFAAALLATAAAAADAPGIIGAEAALVAFPLSVEGLGTAGANESIEVRPKISERIREIQFEEGASVEAGRVLVTLEDAETRAAVAAARANLVDSKGQLRRARELFESKTVSAAELERLVAANDAISAALDAAASRLADTVVRAPFAGRVGLRRVSPGSLVTPATVITTLDDTDPIKLDFDVPETALSRLEVGLPVIANSASWPDDRFEGTVASIDTRVDPVTRSLTVRALVPNPEGRLRPGMFLTVTLLRGDVKALVIPEQAVLPEQSRQFVLVVGADSVVEKREIRTGRRRPGQVEVLDGLRAGELVVAEGTQKVIDGQAVKVIERIRLTQDAP